MSDASKCDRCGTLYEPVQGCVHIGDIQVKDEPPPPDADKQHATWSSSSEIDLCPPCSKAALDVLERAMNDLVRP